MFPENQMVREAVASMWDATCRIFIYRKKKDEDKNVSYMEEEELAGGPFPCRIDIDSAPAAEDSSGPDSVSQEITLILSAEVNIPPGAKILYKPPAWSGRDDEVYINAGVSAVYPLHQEIRLVRKENHT
nr:MAG TPA: hypothetical protein [Caudoviricetes sp.]